jgi:hypothetical protein
MIESVSTLMSGIWATSKILRLRSFTSRSLALAVRPGRAVIQIDGGIDGAQSPDRNAEGAQDSRNPGKGFVYLVGHANRFIGKALTENPAPLFRGKLVF